MILISFCPSIVQSKHTRNTFKFDDQKFLCVFRSLDFEWHKYMYIHVLGVCKQPELRCTMTLALHCDKTLRFVS